MKFYAIIVAGGKGLRMGNDIPKQFIEINGLPILFHTINRFIKYKESIEIVIGLPAEQIEYWKSICQKFDFNYPHTLVAGGDYRFQTVKNCLETIKSEGIVAVHDGVRPCVSLEIIRNCYLLAEAKGSAIPVIPVNDSLRLVLKNGNKSVNREDFKIVQTPQVFKTEIIKGAYRVADNNFYTDDASVVEKAGYKINLVEGSISNIKVTRPADLYLAKVILDNENNQ